ncbi:hypothetical protein BDV29DRAFT_200607 [Aspergillus leporis]|jgi:PhzF family phenazine biosynthesis protein|uniref:Phenazine biosynthesis-like protein n=1 Tax=Aspergillus leporis TaxID=41062 RepID=A0A5N5X511_9EURO|nr:hypothetical protein BDV29DRAFT_200607 [Aspergillus leporis]
MATLPYHIIDVFSSIAYKGNPLAVVDNTSESLNTTQMRLIARQFNLSETTFVCPSTDSSATWRLRSFLPNGEEVFGAGHNSLGAWWWIARSGLLGDSPTGADSTGQVYYQQLGDAVLPVEVSRSNTGETVISMRQGQPQFLGKHNNKDTLVESLGISVADIGLQNSRMELTEAQVITTSPARHLLVPVRNKEVLDRVAFNTERIVEELARTNSHNSGVYVFTSLNQDSTSKIPRYEARFFSPGMSMEDPATGSAAGPLAVYLWVNGGLGSGGDEPKEIEVVQGLKTGRECLMRLTIEPSQESSSVTIVISGTGAPVADGSIRIPAPDTTF